MACPGRKHKSAVRTVKTGVGVWHNVPSTRHEPTTKDLYTVQLLFNTIEIRT